MLGELRDAVKSGDYMAVKLALNSKEEYNLDQEVCSGHSVLYKTRPTQFNFCLMFWMNLVFIYFLIYMSLKISKAFKSNAHFPKCHRSHLGGPLCVCVGVFNSEKCI